MLQRKFVEQDFKVTDWESLKPYFDDLLARSITDINDFKQFLKDNSELTSVLEEDLAWRYIQMTCDTESKEKAELYTYFVTQIQPHIAPISNQIDKKILESPFLEQLKKEKDYVMMIKELEKEVELFCEANVPILAEIQALQQQYAQIMGAMTVHVNGQEMTLQQAGVLLESPDRTLREDVWRKISERRYVDKDKLDDLMSTLIAKRHQVAVNAGFANYRDYAFKARGRYDYTPQDCFDFHQAIRTQVVPILNELAQKRKELMKLDQLRPWDKKADKTGKPPVKAFEDDNQLIDNTLCVLSQLDPDYVDILSAMRANGHLDLQSRKGKAPGGYNYPLYESGYPFIFMNATGTVRDMVTMLHEVGHAIHSFLTKDLELTAFKNLPAEIAELASMSMELMSMQHWHYFFFNSDNLNAELTDLFRAKLDHLEDIISTLPWVATVDAFQHWLYENPHHTAEERHQAWIRIADSFSDNVTDMSGLEHFKAVAWHRQLHIFELPFYYIEYAIAQLGAIAMWKNYKTNEKQTCWDYRSALSLGYTRSIKEVYERAGVKFDFSAENISKLMSFVREEIKKLEEEYQRNS